MDGAAAGVSTRRIHTKPGVRRTRRGLRRAGSRHIGGGVPRAGGAVAIGGAVRLPDQRLFWFVAERRRWSHSRHRHSPHEPQHRVRRLGQWWRMAHDQRWRHVDSAHRQSVFAEHGVDRDRSGESEHRVRGHRRARAVERLRIAALLRRRQFVDGDQRGRCAGASERVANHPRLSYSGGTEPGRHAEHECGAVRGQQRTASQHQQRLGLDHGTHRLRE